MAGCRDYGSSDITDGGSAGTATASSEFGPTWAAPKAFDDNGATYWAATSGTNEWIKFAFSGDAVISARVTVHAYIGAGGVNTWKNFTFEGSNNDSDWTQLYSGQHPQTGGKQTYDFDNIKAYLYYRFSVTDVWGANNAAAWELEIVECLLLGKKGGLKDSSLTPVVSPGLKVDARKPYVYNKRHVSEMFRIPDRYIKQIIDKESEFEKPYLDWGYQEMHLNLPVPDWPGIRVPKVRTRHPRRPEIWYDPSAPNGPEEEPEVGYGSSCVGCIINCNHPPTCNDEGTTVECHAAQFCTQDSSGDGKDTSWFLEIIKGDIVEEREGSWHFPSVEYEIDTTEPQFVAVVHFFDGLGYECTEEIDIQCCNCLTAAAVSVADGTIAPGGSTGVVATGGCPPYTWDVAGTGYSLEFNVTEDGNNTLTSAGGTCGDGNDYSPYAIVTANDLCNDSDSGYIRNTGGQWANKSSDACVVSGASNDGSFGIFYRIEDNKRQKQSLYYTAGSGVGATCAGAGTCAASQVWCPDTIECIDCLTGMVDDVTLIHWPITVTIDNVCQCYDFSNCGGGPDNCYVCYCNTALSYDEWEC